jgi:anti-sigma B factor antagonist
MATVEPLRDAARRVAASREYEALVIDLLAVDFIDSSGLHALTDAHNAMKAAGGRTTIVCASPSIRKVFELTGLDRLLTIVDDRPHAYPAAA